jgi:protein-S-isoprenylcysteine O-methyltransferase Ste14
MPDGEQAKREPGSGQLFGELFFVIVVLNGIGHRLDQWLGLPPLGNAQLDFLIGELLIIAGAVFAWWANDIRSLAARGTQVPGQMLLTHGPYAYCRHPGSLGCVLLCLGFAMLFSSIATLVIVLLTSAAGLVSVKKKEKELEARFGQEYVEYRKRTPFLLPLGKGK